MSDNNKFQKNYPLEISYSKKNKVLTVLFSNKEKFNLSSEYLRISSPSAEVQTHNPQTRIFVPGKNMLIYQILKRLGIMQ